MSVEFYSLEWKSKRLYMEEMEEAPFGAGEEFIPPSPWEVHSCLGDDNKIWCEVYRAQEQSGGVFVLRDFDEVLFVAVCSTNLSFVHALDFFARVTSNTRYAADIFEHADEDADD